MNQILMKYKNELKYIENYLKNDLSKLEIEAAQIYGSIVYDGCFVEGVSDIDLCVYTKKMDEMDLNDIVDIVMSTNIDFKDKQPTIIDDYIARRIEFYVKTENINFDITILSPALPRKENICTKSSYDSIDMIIGALYIHGIPLFGEIPDKLLVEKEYLPFYNDDIRKIRLAILSKRIISYKKRVEYFIEEKNSDLLDHTYKLRNHFIKWLFIYKRKYPVNVQKHLEYQLKEILNLKEKDINTLLFLNDMNIFESSKELIKLLNKYFDEYFGGKL